MAVMTRAQFQRELFPGIRELIFRGYKEFPEEWSQIFNVLTSDKAFEEDNQIAGTTLFVRTPENVEAAEDAFYPGFPKRYQHDKFTLSVGTSHELRRDDKSGFWRERSPELGFSARQTKEILHADLFNSGFTTANGPDGKALFATDHPNIRGGTQSNILTPVSTLNVLGARIALTQMRRFFDHTGVRRRMLMPEKVVVPPELQFDAEEIFKSMDRPDTANRATNVISGKLTVFVWDYLTDVNNWFVYPSKSQTKIKSFTREEFSVREFMDDRTLINWVQAMFAFSFGFSDWLGPLGSNPV